MPNRQNFYIALQRLVQLAKDLTNKINQNQIQIRVHQMLYIYQTILHKLRTDDELRYSELRSKYLQAHPESKSIQPIKKVTRGQQIASHALSEIRNQSKPHQPLSTNFGMNKPQLASNPQKSQRLTVQQQIKKQVVQTAFKPQTKQAPESRRIENENMDYVGVDRPFATSKQFRQQPASLQTDRPISKNAVTQPASEQPTDEAQLFECQQGCGRSFNASALEKHSKICRKVFQEKRKQFSAAEQRETQELKEVDTKVSKNKTKKQKQPQAQKDADGKTPKWLKQSLAFRAAMKQTKGEPLTQEEKAALAAPDDSLKECRGCGRKFNEKAAEKHIPNCEKRNKK